MADGAYANMAGLSELTHEATRCHDAPPVLLPPIGPAPGPVDRVVERVRRADGAAWLDLALCRTTGIDRRIAHTFARDPHDLGLLRALSDEARARCARATSPDAIDEATATYYLMAAVALSQYRVVIVVATAPPLADVLDELRRAAPPPWQATLERALARS